MKGFLILIFSISSLFLFGQSKSSTDRAALKRVVKEYKQAIATSDDDQFKDLFFSRTVPYVGIMSAETESATKTSYGTSKGTDISDHKEFINSIVNSEKKQRKEIYNIKTNSDGIIGGISFDYASYNGRTMKQWGQEKWNLVKTRGEWLITDVVYSIHYPDIEPSPFDNEEKEDYQRNQESADLDVEEEEIAPEKPLRKPTYKKRRKRFSVEDAADDDENIDDDDEEYARVEYEEEEERKKPVVKKKKPFTVYVNDIKNRALIAGVQNKVKIDYEGVDPTKIELFFKAKDVEFRKEDDGNYIIKPLKKVDDFPAYIRVGGKTINYTFKVKGIPLPVARLGRQQTSQVRSSVFKSEAGLLAVVPSPSSSIKQGKCRIQSFILSKNPDTKDLKSKLNQGGRYEQSTLKLVKSAKAGDVYVFEQIKCICAGESSSRKLKDLRFDIK